MHLIITCNAACIFRRKDAIFLTMPSDCEKRARRGNGAQDAKTGNYDFRGSRRTIAAILHDTGFRFLRFASAKSIRLQRKRDVSLLGSPQRLVGAERLA